MSIPITTAAADTTIEDMLYLLGQADTNVASTAVLDTTPTQIIYRVRAGDTLASIAMSQYGDATLWPTIANANSIKDPAGIAVGQQLIIPSYATAS